jgi:hypothetical protein
MKSTTSMSLLLAGLMAFAGAAQAQQSKAEVRQGAHNMDKASATSNVPPRAGEASTFTGGAPNLLTSNPQPGEHALTREEVRAGAMHGTSVYIGTDTRGSGNDTRVMGASRAYVDIGVPANAPAGTPPVFQGGTPE